MMQNNAGIILGLFRRVIFIQKKYHRYGMWLADVLCHWRKGSLSKRISIGSTFFKRLCLFYNWNPTYLITRNILFLMQKIRGFLSDVPIFKSKHCRPVFQCCFGNTSIQLIELLQKWNEIDTGSNDPISAEREIERDRESVTSMTEREREKERPIVACHLTENCSI